MTCRINKSVYDEIPCDNWPCLGMGKAKYFIGDPVAHVPKLCLCEDCVADMLGNIPSELEEYLPALDYDVEQDGEVITALLVNPPKYKCQHCEETFDSPQKLGIHKRKHQKKV